MRLEIQNNCPICKSYEIIKLSNIKSLVKEINSRFDLMKCQNCLHRFISKIPNQLELNRLYEIDSPLVIGKTAHELEQKETFIKNDFENIEPQLNHWIFDYIENNAGKYFELGPGLCRLYKTFYLKGWKCQGLEQRSFIKIKGIKRDIKDIENDNDVIAAFDVFEHLADPVEMLKEMKLKIKNEGKIFLTYPHSESFKSRILKDRWPMISPLGHIHFFSKKSTKIMLEKTGYEVLIIEDFSFVELRKLVRNIFKLPIFILKDIFKFNFKGISQRVIELFLNILDLINGDQLKVVAKKKSVKN